MKIATIVLNVILLLALIPVILAAIMSPMIFDAVENQNLWRIFWTMIALPVVIVGCQIISWVAFYRQNYSFAFKVSLLPVIHVLLLAFLVFVIGFESPDVKAESSPQSPKNNSL